MKALRTALRVGMLSAWWFISGCGVVPASAGAYGGTPSTPAAQQQRLANATPAGQSCDDLCTLTQLHCKNENRAYASYDACMANCAGIAELGAPAATHGNSIQCRLTYALLSRHTLTMWFCQNASATGGLQCR